MVYLCPMCDTLFSNRVDHNMHVIECSPPKMIPIVYKIRPVVGKTYTPIIPRKGEYQPMDIDHKRYIVSRVEKRLDKFLIS